ncbi:hypothetical protein GQ607_013618 [Colletotrichum asianum]|uniref:Uncharacterized protein n=1 Tax=Colletotrichum asianum TaxID=702518 RepID=A0A8H3W4F7_9PEZI|nr:hypothetical protein GQ607_013618 [Colletotrichum asianum]
MTIIGRQRARSRSKHSRAVLLSYPRMTLSAVRASSVPGPSALPRAGSGAAAPGPQFQVPSPRCDALITLRLGNHTPESRLSCGGTYARNPPPLHCMQYHFRRQAGLFTTTHCRWCFETKAAVDGRQCPPVTFTGTIRLNRQPTRWIPGPNHNLGSTLLTSWIPQQHSV